MTSRLAAWIRGDLLRAVRLAFLAALALVGAASAARIATMELSARTVAFALTVLGASIVLRAIEYRTDRPVAWPVDIAEVSGLMAVLGLLHDIDALLGVIFFLVLCRSAVSGLRRLLPLVTAFVGGWLLVSELQPAVVVHVGAVIALPVVALLVFAMRSLMLRLQAQHAERSALLSAVLARLPYPVVVVGDAGDILLTNPAAIALTGSATLHDVDVRDTRGRPVDLRLLDTDGAAVEARLTRPDGEVAHVRAQAVPMDGGTVIALLDVTAQRHYEKQLQHAAFHDSLTGLPNRALLWQRLVAAQAGGAAYAVMLVDLDGFKQVNDRLGHQAGDEVLRAVAERLSHTAGPSATVARLGGDEFAVVLGDGGKPAAALAEALKDCFIAPFRLSAGPLRVGGTVGCAVGNPGQSPDEVLAAADQAMYRDKPSPAHDRHYVTQNR